MGVTYGTYASSALVQRKRLRGAAMVRMELFKCPDCGALYRVIKVEAGPETVDHQVSCRACGAPLDGRDRQFVPQIFPLADPGPSAFAAILALGLMSLALTLPSRFLAVDRGH